MKNNVIELENIEKIYDSREKIVGIKDISLNFKYGKLYAITGHSGSGKSTLLQVIGLLKDKTAGTYKLFGYDVDSISDSKKTDIRNENIGFIFQDFYLDEDINALENIMLPYYISRKKDYKSRKAQILKEFENIGIKGKENKSPKELSAGQKARVAFLRALVNNPDVILADEPTGNLDKDNEKMLFKMLKQLAKEGKCVIVVSHSKEINRYADIKIAIENGTVYYEK